MNKGDPQGLKHIYEEIEKRVSKVDFPALWAGFSPLKFAVYTDAECYFDGHSIEKTDAFCANTSILFNGEYIAIWNVLEEPNDFDALCASIIHEMFHAFQLKSGEARFADEKEALLKYRYCAENLSAKLAEAGCISSILEGGDCAAYAELLSLRKMRARRYPYAYDYEARVEQIEGTAKYVELNALAQLNAQKGRRAWQELLERICSPQAYLPIRLISYEVGAALIACLKKCSGMDCETFTDEPFACQMICDVDASAVCVPNHAGVEECLKRYFEETHRIIEAAMEKNDCVLKGKYPLVTVNIYDARREGRYLTSNYFVMYMEGEEQKILYGDFVIEVDAEYHILAVLKQ